GMRTPAGSGARRPALWRPVLATYGNQTLARVTDAPRTDSYTLSLHDALPISRERRKRPDLLGRAAHLDAVDGVLELPEHGAAHSDRKSTRLNSSHRTISYAVFCLQKKTAPVAVCAGDCGRAP